MCGKCRDIARDAVESEDCLMGFESCGMKFVSLIRGVSLLVCMLEDGVERNRQRDTYSSRRRRGDDGEMRG
jgi:hypothetical protein